MTVALTAAAAAAVVAGVAVSTTMLAPESEDDSRQDSSEHDEARPAGSTDQYHISRVTVSTSPTPVNCRPVPAAV